MSVTFCTNCGNKISGEVKFCGGCGMEIQLEKSTASYSNKDEPEIINGSIMKFGIGRLNRSGFILSMVISFAVVILLMVFTPIEVGMTFVFINFVWMMVLYTGRLHDTGKSGWWTIPIMLLSLLGMTILACTSGTKKANKYGEVPPKSLSHLLYFWRTKKNL